MNKPFHGSCRETMDEIYGSSWEETIPLLQRFRVQLHLFLCPSCAEEVRKLRILEELSRSDFFPSSPSFEAKVMERLSGEYFQAEIEGEDISGAGIVQDLAEAPGGFSFRSWVIIGFLVLVSLAFPFFGIDFFGAVANKDSSYLIPLGITVGTVLTGYGAFFIASHLEELSEHFNIH